VTKDCTEWLNMAEAFIRSGLQMAANDVDGEDSQLIQGS